ncbi:MAG: hypothetical protein IAE91_15615, partial [Ignavibacteriaceae bacterium]|nr:hypothetical protein [Ignavibacteriaceae bacterium]
MLKISLIIFLFSSIALCQWENTFHYDTTSLRSVVSLNDSSFLVAGTKGGIFKTVNSGKSWMIKSFNNIQDFVKLIKINEQRIVIYDNLANIYLSTNGGDSWDLIHNFGFWFRIKTLFFLDESIGYAIIIGLAGNNPRLLKTVDGGYDWLEVATLPSAGISQYSSLFFFNSDVGFATSTTNSGTGILFKTIDGGLTWSSFYTFTKPIYDIYFSDINTGYITGTGVFKTENGGAFFYSTMFSNIAIKSIRGISKDTITVLTSNGSIRATTNGGADWNTILAAGFSGGGYSDFDFTSSLNLGFATGYKDSLYYTTNGGSTWQNFNFPKVNLSYLRAINDSSCLVYDHLRLLFLTTDRGKNWEMSRFKPDIIWSLTTQITDIYQLNDSVFFAISDRGEIFRSSDILLNWNRVSHIPTYNSRNVIFWNENLAFQSGKASSSAFYGLTSNAGVNWSFTYITQNLSIIKSILTKDLVLFFVTEKNVFKSRDSAKTRIQITPEGFSGFTNIQFVDSITGFVLSDRKFFRTTDGGDSWQNYNYPRDEEFTSFHFLDHQTGFATNVDGIFKTTNGGIDWVQETPGILEARYITFANPNLGWAIIKEGSSVTGRSAIYKLDTSGTTSIFENNNVNPGSFAVFQNYPNPFNPITRISYNLNEAGFVSVRIHNLLGQEVKFFEKSYK